MWVVSERRKRVVTVDTLVIASLTFWKMSRGEKKI